MKPIRVDSTEMRVQRVTVEVPVSFWSCGSSRCDKRHESEETAIRCPLRRPERGHDRKARLERLERIVSLRDSGMTFKAIGEEVGHLYDPSKSLCVTQVSQLYQHQLRRGRRG